MAVHHRLKNVNSNKFTADCAVCGPAVPIRSIGTKPNGRRYYRCDTALRRDPCRARYAPLDPTVPRHYLSNLDHGAGTADCTVCGPSVPMKYVGARTRCLTVVKARIRRPQGARAKINLECCARCGFIPEDTCQIQADHIVRTGSDGGTNARSNLQALCANCHALKSGWEGRGVRFTPDNPYPPRVTAPPESSGGAVTRLSLA